MKYRDTIRLAFRNLCNNFSHFLLTLISIVLLSTAVMTIGNFCYNYKINADRNNLYAINQEGTNVSMKARGSSDSCIESKTIEDFIKLARENNFDDYSDIRTLHIPANPNNYVPDNVAGEAVELKPYIGGCDPQIADFKIIKGEMWSKDDDAQNFIWLSEQVCDKLNIIINDKITLNFNGKTEEMLVKGITAHYTFISYKYLNVTSLTLGQFTNNYESFDHIKSIIKIINNFANDNGNVAITGNIMSEMLSNEIGIFVYGLCIALIVFCAAMTVACLINTVKISIENNNSALGLMKALGAKNREIKAYIICQISILIVLGTIIATIISALISYFLMGTPIKIIMSMLFTETFIANTTSTFWFVIPLLNLVVVGGIVILCTFPMLKRYVKTDAIKIINEGNL